MNDDVLERVRQVIAKSQRLDVDRIQAASTFAELNIDSLDGLQIVFALEEEFSVDIPDDEARNFTSIGQVADGLRTLIQKKQAASA